MHMRHVSPFVAAAIALLTAMASADDPNLPKWLEAAKGITAVEATFTIDRWRPDGEARDTPLPCYRLCYDLKTGDWQATVESTAHRILEDGTREPVPSVGYYGTAGGISWDGSRNRDGTSSFVVAPAGQEGNGIVRNALVAQAGYDDLERCLYPPFTLQLRKGLANGMPLEAIQKVLTLESDQPSETVPGARELAYAMRHGNMTATVTYCVDFGDGVRAYETVLPTMPPLVKKTTCTDFRKVDGRWVAMTSTESECTRNPDGKEEKQTGRRTVTITEIKLNESCHTQDIGFPATIGDRVRFPGDTSRVVVEDMVDLRARLDMMLGRVGPVGAAPDTAEAKPEGEAKPKE